MRKFQIQEFFQVLFGIIILALISSCKTLKLSAKKGFNEGIYRTYIDDKKVEKAYVVPSDESIKIYSLIEGNKDNVDTAKFVLIDFPEDFKPDNFKAYSFRKASFDLGAISVLFKFRPTIHDFPPQLNTSFNGSIYIGLRTDRFKLKYRETPLHLFKKSISHYGYSFGIFSGIGTELVNEFTTENGISIEYDGLINLSGIVAHIGLNNLTLGLAVGEDHLLDKNKHVWIYNGRPWIGLSVGLNLN